MILKGNMLKLTIPFFWAVQSIWLLSFKSIETFIAAIILLLISFLGIVIKSNTWKIQCKLPPKTKRFCPLVLK